MRKQDQLVTLIQSLTPAEKKYFVQQANADGQNKSYLKLYEALLKARRYDANELSVRLGKKKADLANEKKYLGQLLMKSLRGLYSEQNPRTRFLNRYIEVSILHDKGQFEYAYHLIEKIKEEAEKNEFWHIYLDVLGQEKMLVYRLEKNEKKAFRKASLLLKQQQKAVRNFQLIYEYEKLFERALAIFGRQNVLSDVKKAEVNRIIHHPLLAVKTDSRELLNLKATILWHCYYAIGNYKSGLKYALQRLHFIEKYPTQFFTTTSAYLTAINNCLYFMMSAQEYETTEQYMAQLEKKNFESLPVDIVLLKFELSNIILDIRLSIAGHTQNINKGLSAVKKLDSNYEQIKNEGRPRVLAQMIGKAAHICFLAGKYDDALCWIDKLLSHTSDEASPLSHGKARMLYLLAWVETNDIAILPTIVQSTKRYLKKYKMLRAAEREVLLFYSHFTKWLNEKERKQAYLKLYKKILALKKDPREAQSFSLIRYDLWIERKVKQIAHMRT